MQYRLVKLNTARNALRYVINAFEIKEIYIPYYICPAIRNAANKEKCRIIYYHIGSDFRPLQDFPSDSFILYPNYFGVCSDIVKELSELYKNLIIDNAHSFFSEPGGIASFNSLRKFFPNLRDGSFLYTKRTADVNIIRDTFFYEEKNLSYEEICRNENRLDGEDIKYISDCTLEYFGSINIEREKNKRIEKIIYWKKLLDPDNKLNVNPYDLPFCYPFLPDASEKADSVVKKLNEQNITVFRYWNNLPDNYPEKIFYTSLAAI